MQLKMTENLKVGKGGQFKVHPHLFGSGFAVKFLRRDEKRWFTNDTTTIV